MIWVLRYTQDTFFVFRWHRVAAISYVLRYAVAICGLCDLLRLPCCGAAICSGCFHVAAVTLAINCVLTMLRIRDRRIMR
jgi:hypothetical protein